MAKELVLDVVARKNSAALVQLADDFEKLKHEVDDNGKSFSEAESFSKRLDDQIEKTRTQVQQLGEEFDKTGNKDVFSNLKGAQSNLRQLEGIQKSLKDALPPAQELDKSIGDIGRELLSARKHVTDLTTEFRKTGSVHVFNDLKDAEKDVTRLSGLFKDLNSHLGNSQSFLQKLRQSVSSGLSSIASDLPEAIGPQGLIIGGIIVATAGPVITAGLTAAVGAGLIAGAAFLDKDDPKLHAALAGIKQDTIDTLKGAAAPLADELTSVVTSFDKFVKSESPDIAKSFANIGPAISSVGASLEHILAPIIEQLPRVSATFTRIFNDPDTQRSLSEIGHSLGDLFGTVAKNGHLAVQFFEGLAFAVRAVVAVLNAVTVAANGFYGGIEKANSFLEKFGFASVGLSVIFEHQGEVEGKLIGKTDEYGNTLTDTAAAAQKLQTATDDLNKSFSEVFGQTLDADQATLQYKQDLLEMADAIKQNGHSLSENTQGGIANRQMLLGLAQDAERVREATIAQGHGTTEATAEANVAFRKQIQDAENLAAKLGLPKSVVDQILNQYKNLAAQPDIDKRVTIHNVTYTSQIDLGTQNTHHDSFSKRYGGIMKAAAQGAIFAASNPPLVKFAEPETGGEAYIPRKGITRAAAAGLISTAASWYGMSLVGGVGGGGGNIATSVQVVGNAGDGVALLIQELLRTNKLIIRSQFVK